MTATIERLNGRHSTPAVEPRIGEPTRERTTGPVPEHGGKTGTVPEREAKTGPAPERGTESTRQRATRYVWAAVRLALGWTFLWAFLDKTFGLGHETESKAAWINGGHPTQGFLKFAATGPFERFYQGIAGAAWADWLFMLGLAGLAVALLLGIGLRLAAVAGGLLFVLMWAAVLPPENNIFLDDHLINALVLAGLALVGAGDTLGLGRWWARLPLVRRASWLR